MEWTAAVNEGGDSGNEAELREKLVGQAVKKASCEEIDEKLRMFKKSCERGSLPLPGLGKMLDGRDEACVRKRELGEGRVFGTVPRIYCRW